MSTQLDASVLPVQQMMAWAQPALWVDAFVVEVRAEFLVVATLDGDTRWLRVGGQAGAAQAAQLRVGEPVSFHRTAELLHTGRTRVTAAVVA